MDGEMIDEPTEPVAVDDPVATDGAVVGDTEVEAPTTGIVDLDTVIAERDSFKDTAMRLQADFENYRKRSVSQQVDEIQRATGKFAESLLPTLDACEAAFSHGVAGVEPIWSSLLGVLQRQGLEAMDLADKPFDPAVAEAVMTEPGEGDAIVVEVLRTGYLWKGKVLRAAMVKVRG